MNKDQKPNPATLIVETGSGGHRHLHVRKLCLQLWSAENRHPDHVWWFLSAQVAEQVLALLDPRIASVLKSRIHIAPPSAPLRDVFAAAQSTGAGQVFFLEIDEYIYDLALRPLPFTVSGVWFRVNFHYRHFGIPQESFAQTLKAFLKRLMLLRLCARRNIRALLVLDKTAADYARTSPRIAKLAHVPDPVGFPSLAGDRQPRDPASKRYVIAIVGAISRRKGVLTVLQALEGLGPECQEKLELRIVGRSAKPERDEIAAAVQRARDLTRVHVFHEDAFVSDEQIDRELAGADLNLLLYQRFVGSSGVLIRSALHARPVLATKFGLIGYLVEQNRLGVTADPYSSAQVAAALQLALENPVANFDAAGAAEFAVGHSPDVYAQRLAAIVLNHTSLPKASSSIAAA